MILGYIYIETDLNYFKTFFYRKSQFFITHFPVLC